jgi:hypothetical protein
MQNYFLFFILLLELSSCKPDPNSRDEPLCSSRVNNVSNSLRLGGIYYYISPAVSEHAFVFILNANGTVGQTTVNLPLSNGVTVFSSSAFLRTIRDNKNYFGVYHIEGSNIYIDRWHGDSNGRDYGYRWSCEILSDSSFKIFSSSRCDGSELRSRDEVYNFYPLESKPDSVTSLIL